MKERPGPVSAGCFLGTGIIVGIGVFFVVGRGFSLFENPITTGVIVGPGIMVGAGFFIGVGIILGGFKFKVISLKLPKK